VDKLDLSSIKVCNSGSAPLPVEVLQRFEDLTGAKISEGFGLTETSPLTHCNPSYGMRKKGSVGVPVPDTDAKIVLKSNNPNASEIRLRVHFTVAP